MSPEAPADRELFLEVRSQELAPEQVRPLLKILVTRIFEELMSRGIVLREIRTGATPRRLALAVDGLPDHEPDREEILEGPSLEEAFDGETPTEALVAFCAEHGIEPDDATELATERGRFLAHRRKVPGQALKPVLEEMLHRHLHSLVPGSRSGPGGSWPRPVTGIAALLDGEPLDITFEKQASTAETVGGPADAPRSIPIDGYAGWLEALLGEGLEPSWDARRRRLTERADELADEVDGEILWPAGLLARLTASCAVPGVFRGRILDDEALRLPGPLLIHVLDRRLHAAAVHAREASKAGELLPYFVTVMDRQDDPDGRIRRGYERALSGHLADARHAYRADQAIPLARRVRRLEQLIFHPDLGTWAEKSRRLKALVEPACAELGFGDVLDPALEAASLLKADLGTEAAAAFPDLRGTLGGIYAREEGYVEVVWQAIHDQYLPRRPEDPIPRSRVGQVVAVADRLGSLVGFFGIGGAPASPQARRRRDPHGLRPLADGLLRILIDGELSLDLDLLTARAVQDHGDRLRVPAEELWKALQTFLDERLDLLLGGRGYGRDEIEAVKAVGTADLPDLVARLTALRTVRGEPGFGDLVAAAKRISKTISGAPETSLDPSLLEHEAEIELARAVQEVSEHLHLDIAEKRYEDALRRLVALAPVLERFFSDVLIMDENEVLRAHRIGLLQSCRRLYWRVARLSAMEVETWVASDS